MTERERERNRELLTKYALPPYDFITDDMTVPFAIELAEKDAEIERLRAALVAIRDRDDKNGSLPQAYRDIVDGALEQTGDAK